MTGTLFGSFLVLLVGVLGVFGYSLISGDFVGDISFITVPIATFLLFAIYWIAMLLEFIRNPWEQLQEARVFLWERKEKIESTLGQPSKRYPPGKTELEWLWDQKNEINPLLKEIEDILFPPNPKR